ncbi:hypothetical protein EW146_g1349 [Bondarzewia mesenterica]|uniref:F-box domain-containing protein n=1 Tax=Bondarzewia mesenterica TaxID=1095465 RepID=A0A4S4M439_9AGAM|nr:hypothetical protein EW146_g1349 [Bondarzewia mesenterica]
MSSNRETLITRILYNPAVLDAIFSFSTPGTIIRLAMTCRRVREAMLSYFRAAFNINRHLSRFFPDPIAFRQLQARTASLIAGSNALQFFERTIYPEADLDLYVYPRSAGEVGRFLLEIGYQFKPASTQNLDFETALVEDRVATSFQYPGPIHDIFQFVKESAGDGDEELKIEIVSSRMPFASCVMNVISYEKAYSLYPLATFETRISFLCTKDAARRQMAIKKYTPRGWTVSAGKRKLGKRACLHLSFRRGVRSLNDRHTWGIPLNTVGITAESSTPDTLGRTCDPVVASRWQFNDIKMRFSRQERTPFFPLGIGSSFFQFAYVIDDAILMEAALRFKFLILLSWFHWLFPILLPSTLAPGKFYDAEFIQFCQDYEAGRTSQTDGRPRSE